MSENYVVITDFPSGISFAMHDLCQRVKFLKIYLIETKKKYTPSIDSWPKECLSQIRDSFFAIKGSLYTLMFISSLRIQIMDIEASIDVLHDKLSPYW